MRSGDVIAERYRLVELIGSGGMGIVWLAEDLVESRQVALKRPHEATGTTLGDLAREADVARRVTHPNAVQVFEVVADGWLVMEHFPATTLAHLLDQRLAPARVAAIGAQVAAALAAAHAAQVVHRDVTPANILVNDDDVAKVTDYGISAWQAATITSSGKISGTAAYVSPEVADGEGAKAASDVFSLGATLFAAVEGTPPFGVGDPDVVLAHIRDGRAEPFRHAGPLAPVLAALLQRDRAARPSAEQARELLEAVASGQPLPEWIPAAPRVRPRWPLVVGVVAAVVAIAVVAGLLWTSKDPVRTALGDPRTADPCALLDAAAFDRFGPARLDADYGGFNRCDVLVDLTDDIEMDVMLQFHGQESDEPPPETVRRSEPEIGDGDCAVTLTLTDFGVIELVTETDEWSDAELCEVADEAADHVEGQLSGLDEVPRRAEPDPRSLALVDACALLTPADLDAEPDPGFADWQCRWDDLQVLFDKGNAASAEDGATPRQLSGHDVYVEEGGYGDETCVARVVNLRYQNDSGDALVEMALVVADGDQPMAQLCEQALAFAGPVASRLPS